MLLHPLKGALGFGLLSVLFVSIYKPLFFNTSEKFGYYPVLAMYVLGSVLALIPFLFLLRKNLREYNLGNALLFMVLVLSFGGVVGYFLGFALEAHPNSRWHWATFFDSMGNTYLGGSLPVLILWWYGHFKSPKEAGTPTKNQSIRIRSELKKEFLDIDPENLIYLEAEGNYVKLFFDSGQEVTHKLLRSSMNKMEVQLQSFPFMYRSHRSYMVNLRKMEAKSGNSMGYRLRLTNIDSQIPVSRNKTTEFDAVLEKLG